jgi:hypothetical protein
MRTAVAPHERAPEPAADDPLVVELERLWETSPDEPLAAAAKPPRRRRFHLHRVLSQALVYGWIALFVALFTVAPAPDPAVRAPFWVDAASFAILVGVLAAALVAGIFPRIALACSALAAGLGVPVGIACRATEHHAGSWWLVETGAFAALAVASVACLATWARR